MKLAGEGDYAQALRVILEKNALPFITGTLCAHNCMYKCTRNFYEEPVNIRNTKLIAAQNGYDTVIGEGGATLSGGEKQRISIARAIMKDAPIVILDEATANVDPENEKELMDAVDALTKEKTIIMIAHRLKTVRHADQIVVVDKGRIVQQGTHEQLMKQEGIYKRFVDARQQAVSWKLAH